MEESNAIVRQQKTDILQMQMEAEGSPHAVLNGTMDRHEYKSKESEVDETEIQPLIQNEMTRTLMVDEDSDTMSEPLVPRGFESATKQQQCVVFGFGCW